MEADPPNPPPSEGFGPLSPPDLAVAATFGVFLLFLFTSPLQGLNLALGLWFSQLFVFLGGGWIFLRATGREPARATGLLPWRTAPAVFGFALGLANFFGIVAPVQYLAQLVLPESWQDYDVAGIFLGQSPLELVLIIAGVGMGAPLCEEFFFRGVFLRGLLARGGRPGAALFFSSVFFSAFHLDRMGFVSRLELGLLFGWLLWRTGSLWPGILAHAANNLVSTALFFGAEHLDASSASTPAGAPSSEEARAVLLLALGGGAVLLGLGALARRHPSLLNGPPRSLQTHEAPEPPVWFVPLDRLARLMLPWVLAAALALGVYVLADPRGIEVSQVDQHYPLSSVPPGAPDVFHAEREALYQLRVRARRGEVSLGAYAQERRRQSQQTWGGRAPPPPSPAPLPPPSPLKDTP